MRILILGIGNILFGDEGIGVHLCNYLKVNYSFSGPCQLDFVDGGTLAQSLIPLIVEYDEVLILDCVDVRDAQVGDVYAFPFNKVPNMVTWAGSAHEVEMLQTLKLIEVMGDLPAVEIIGIVPYIIGEETTFNLTQEVKNGAKLMEKKALEFLQARGFSYQKVKDFSLQEIANHSFRGVDDL